MTRKTNRPKKKPLRTVTFRAGAVSEPTPRQQAVAGGFALIAAAANSANDTITEMEAFSLIAAHMSVIAPMLACTCGHVRGDHLPQGCTMIDCSCGIACCRHDIENHGPRGCGADGCDCPSTLDDTPYLGHSHDD